MNYGQLKNPKSPCNFTKTDCTSAKKCVLFIKSVCTTTKP